MPDDFRWILGLDIGGTNVVVGLVPMEGGSLRDFGGFLLSPKREARPS